MDEIFTGLADKRLLFRERAVNKLTRELPTMSPEDVKSALNRAIELVEDTSIESKLGALMAMRKLATIDSLEVLVGVAEQYLDHPEHRVRCEVAKLLELLCGFNAVHIFTKLRNKVMNLIKGNLERSAGVEDDETKMHFSPGTEGDSPEIHAPSVPFGATMAKHTSLMHDTEGWKHLETAIMQLQHMLEGSGSAATQFVDQEMLDILFVALSHTNRFVREIGLKALGMVSLSCDEANLRSLAITLVPKLAEGLADNWSQVRWSASVATRQFIEAADRFKREFDDVLLPRMCLNRHYVAEGVRLYSQRNWEMMVGQDGRKLLAKHIDSVVNFYTSQSLAPNHAVREGPHLSPHFLYTHLHTYISTLISTPISTLISTPIAACHVIAELAVKVEAAAVRPHVDQLTDALINMFKDGSWPVRDAACLATGRFVLAFPQESTTRLDELYPLWFAHISDNIPSVRYDTAAALGNVMRAYGNDAITRVIAVLRSDLDSAKTQEPDSRRMGGMANVTHFGVADKVSRDNDPDVHTGQLMYSCGSLIARNRPAQAGSTEMLERGGGATDHGLSRIAEPWERTDGCVALVRELAAIDSKAAMEFVPIIAELAGLKHFAHYYQMLESLWRQVPYIARSIGRIAFEPYLDTYISALSHAVKCGNRLTEDSAAKAVKSLKKFLGPEALYPL